MKFRRIVDWHTHSSHTQKKYRFWWPNVINLTQVLRAKCHAGGSHACLRMKITENTQKKQNVIQFSGKFYASFVRIIALNVSCRAHKYIHIDMSNWRKYGNDTRLFSAIKCKSNVAGFHLSFIPQQLPFGVQRTLTLSHTSPISIHESQLLFLFCVLIDHHGMRSVFFVLVWKSICTWSATQSKSSCQDKRV